ncbi:bifunctional hydroxymethylpyrimidine kinase/phosphomethylpyrimidine kinase [Alicyclobacillus sp. SO9]|nr:bifunctional hydroxymethylpyrimidine kinase/phosphomethylpyrimidine kinase [Alicyclobacillus sp. SO9]
MQQRVARALTIAGSDSGGGAGIQADLKTFAAFEIYGASALTAVTAQNTVGVQQVQVLDETLVLQQIDSVLNDIGADAVKIGMLGTASVTTAVAQRLSSVYQGPVVLDPVMVAKGGESLLKEDAVAAVIEHLFPQAAVVTPNIPEAEHLTGSSIRSWDECAKAAAVLSRLGASAVILKGGHASAAWTRDTLPKELQKEAFAIDVLFDGSRFTYFVTPHVESQKTHGTGCTFSSAVAGGLAAGLNLYEAVGTAKQFIYEAILGAATWSVGHGHGPTDHSVRPSFARGLTAGQWYLLKDVERSNWEVIG